MKTTSDHFDMARDRASLRMFNESKDWPHFVLPVKNMLRKDSTGFPVLGVVANPASEKLPLVIYETEMYKPDFNHCPKHEFPSVEAALVAGWVVD